MTDQKQPPVFARTMLELRRRGVAFVALAVGDGPYLPWLRAFVKRHRLSKHVRCLGIQTNARVRSLIAASDCVFLPSTHEGIALSFFEAMASGVPVVGADVGGQRELVTPDIGALIERSDPNAEVRMYTDALELLLQNPEQRRVMGAVGRQRIRESFALDDMGKRMNMLLRRAIVLAASDPRPRPTAMQANQSAVAAVRNVRRASPSDVPWLAAKSPYLRDRLFGVLRKIGMPLYQMGMKLGLHWIDPLKDRIFEAFYPKAE